MDATLGSVDRKYFDLYRVTSDTIDGALTVDWMSGEIREASPALRQYVGDHLNELTLKHRGWEIRLIPHVGYEDAYTETLGLLRKNRFL